jgi:hypothetical protein
MTMVTVSIADGIHFLDADMGRDVLDDFNQETSRSQAFERLGQVPVDAQGFFTLDTFVYPLHRADEQQSSPSTRHKVKAIEAMRKSS